MKALHIYALLAVLGIVYALRWRLQVEALQFRLKRLGPAVRGGTSPGGGADQGGCHTGLRGVVSAGLGLDVAEGPEALENHQQHRGGEQDDRRRHEPPALLIGLAFRRKIPAFHEALTGPLHASAGTGRSSGRGRPHPETAMAEAEFNGIFNRAE